MADNLTGTVINGKYRLCSVLGKGGMGVVYRAAQLDARGEEVRDVAVKMILPELMADSGLIYSKRFLREVRAAARLRSPNTVTVHDFGQSEAGYLYYVMELVTGPTLKEILRRVCPLPIDRAVAIGTQICEALHEAHRLAQPIVHRDLKPANVSVERWPEGVWVKVGDFGIAKVLGEDASELTQTGASLGTPRYMAPEQCLGTAVDGRTDLYALGVVLYETLTGRTPFSGDPMSVMYQHQHTPPPPLPEAVPQALCRLIERLLAKSPDERPRDAWLVREELGQVLVVETGKEAKEPSPTTTGVLERVASPPSGEEAAPLLEEANPLTTLAAEVFVGRTSELGVLKSVLADAPELASVRAGLGLLYLDLGRSDEARAEFERIASSGFDNIPRNWAWPAAIAALAVLCGRLRDTKRAKALYDLLIPCAGYNLPIGNLICFGSATWNGPISWRRSRARRICVSSPRLTRIRLKTQIPPTRRFGMKRFAPIVRQIIVVLLTLCLVSCGAQQGHLIAAQESQPATSDEDSPMVYFSEWPGPHAVLGHVTENSRGEGATIDGVLSDAATVTLFAALVFFSQGQVLVTPELGNLVPGGEVDAWDYPEAKRIIARAARAKWPETDAVINLSFRCNETQRSLVRGDHCSVDGVAIAFEPNHEEATE